jgi:DtxR family Mn-dependent transcriptional regulator
MSKSPAGSISQSVGDYLKAVWSISGEDPASTNAIAEALGVSPASVSSMLAKVSEMGLVDYERYRGADLTPRGRREALRLLRRHRLLETFMIERLNYAWDEVHEEAEAIEHAISDRFAERLGELLGHPTHDPHGDPIPSADGTLPDTPNTPLAQLEIGETLVVARLMTQSSDVLAYLAKLGIGPGCRLTVTAREPLGGLVHVSAEGTPQVLSKELATLIRGEVNA